MAGPEIDRKQVTDSGQLLKDCEALDGELAALKARYEQYFLGVERRPPAIAHKLLRQKVDALKPAVARTAIVKLRIQNLHQKLQTFERLWTRTCQEMENGTYHRDLFKARLHAKHREEERAHQGPLPKAPSSPLASSASPAQGPPPDPLADASLRAVYDSYLTAKKKCLEDTSNLTFETVASALRKQVPALLKKHNAKSIEYKVIVDGGKAILKAIPRKS